MTALTRWRSDLMCYAMNSTMNAGASSLVRFQHPSAEVRPVPTIGMAIPRDWNATEFPGALFALGTPADAGGAWANVIARHERTTIDMRLDQAARMSWMQLTAEVSDAVLVEERVLNLNEHPFYWREIRIGDEGTDGAVTQFQVLFFGPIRAKDRTLDLFSMDFVNPLGAEEEFGPAYLAMLKSLRFS